MSRWYGLGTLLLLATVATGDASIAAQLEDELRSRWLGAWVLTATETYSQCDGRHTNNSVRGTLVTSNGGARFAAGELARVANLHVKKKRIELLLDLSEPLLVAEVEGPFTLYHERDCKVELLVEDLRRPKRAALAALDAELAALVERHATLEEAEASARWNRRRRDAYPEGYDTTLAEYEVWKASRINADIAARIEEATAEGSRAARRAEEGNEEYALGFVAGVRRMARSHWGDCPELLSGSYWSQHRSPPGGHDDDWEEGFENGQRVTYGVELAYRLQRCFVPVP